jgi:uncharacterized protein YjdB
LYYKKDSNLRRVVMKKIIAVSVLCAMMLFQLVPIVPTTPVRAADTNLAYGKSLASSSAFQNLSSTTDGDKNTENYADSYANSGLQWVQIDLGASYSVNDIKLWHYFGDARKYHDVVVQLSNDPTFATGVTTVFNNDTDNSASCGNGTDSEYAEASSGKDIAFNTVNARYARFYSNGSSANKWDQYVEIEIYNLTTAITTGNLAAGKIPAVSSAFKDISFATDGDKNTANFADSYSNTGLQWVQIDLGASYSVNDIKLWHYFGDARKYHDVVVQLSNDPAFATGVTTVFNNDTDNSAGRGTGTGSEYAETSSGNDIAVNNVNARYARFYSNGSTANQWDHYVEIEIYGSNSVPVVNPTSVSLNKTADTLTVGGTDTLTATVMPADASNKNVTWTSSAPSVATVSSTGLVTAVSAGTATITAKTAAGGYTASCAVTVNNPVVHPTSVSLNKTTDTLTVGGTDALTATVMPAGASNKNVTWTSSAPSVATVSSAGLVTAVSIGTATITAKTADGSYTASCAVTVSKAVSTGTPAIYGAAGNGVTNDTSAIQKAINDYDVVDLQGKTYLTNQLHLKSNATVKNGTLISKNAESVLDGYEISNVTIDNVTIDGQNSSETGIFLWLADNASVSNCTVKNIRTKSSIAAGIFLRSCSYGNIYNCSVSNIVGVQNGTVGDDVGTSRGVHLDTCTHMTVDHCNISEIRSLEDGDGIQFLDDSSTIDTNAYNVISNCTFLNCDKRFIKLQQSGVTISGNQLISNNSAEMSAAIISVYASNISIENNILNGNTDVPIAIGSQIVDIINNVSIKNNNISYQQSNWQGTIVLESSSLVENVIIDGNTLNGYTPVQDDGVLIRTYAKNIQITNNTMNNAVYGVHFKKIDSDVTYIPGTSVLQNIVIANNTCSAKYGLHYEENPSLITGLSVTPK